VERQRSGIEFLNAGAPPIPFEQMVGQFYTNPRNPSIAKMFRVTHIAENAGFGMNKLRSWTQLTGGATEQTFQRYCTSCTMYLGKFESPNSDTNQDNESSGKKFGETHWNHSEKDCGLDED